MASDNGWPDPARPGYPANPDRDGWHWVQWPNGGQPQCQWWRALDIGSGRGWPEWRNGYLAARYRYLGACLTPAEVAAAVQAERDALVGLIVALQCDDEPTTACEVLAYLSDVIRARGDTSALDAALAQARREGMEEAARIVEAMPWPVTGTMQMPATQYDATAAIRAAAGEAGE